MIDILYSYCSSSEKDLKELYKRFDLDKYLGEDVASFFTDDPRVIEKRQRVYRDLNETKGLFESFERISVKLTELFYAFEYASIGISGASNEVMLNSACAVNSYISFIEDAFEELRYYELRAEGLKEFFELLKKEKTSEGFKKLKENSESGKVNIRNIKSVTLGVNLDVNLNVLETGLVSINSIPYRSGSFIDKLFSASFNEPSQFECLCPLSEMGKALKREEISAVNFRLNKALDKLLSKSFGNISKSTKQYLSSVCSELAKFKRGLSFYLNAIRFFRNAENMGMAVCLPEISEKYYVKDLCNYRITCNKGVEKTVPNSFGFDERGRIYILTGANSGGKTVFLESLVTAQLLFQLGLPIFSDSAKLFPFRRLHVFFGGNDNGERNIYGRFENEAIWFSNEIKCSDEGELFIMDELFSGTSSQEAAEVSLTALQLIKAKKGYAVFSTHLHDVAKQVDGRKNETEFSCFDNLTIKTEGEKRLYSVNRGTPESYESKAMTIARKYGIIIQ